MHNSKLRWACTHRIVLSGLAGGTHKANLRKNALSSNASMSTITNSVCRHE